MNVKGNFNISILADSEKEKCDLMSNDTPAYQNLKVKNFHVMIKHLLSDLSFITIPCDFSPSKLSPKEKKLFLLTNNQWLKTNPKFDRLFPDYMYAVVVKVKEMVFLCQNCSDKLLKTVSSCPLYD